MGEIYLEFRGNYYPIEGAMLLRVNRYRITMKHGFRCEFSGYEHLVGRWPLYVGGEESVVGDATGELHAPIYRSEVAALEVYDPDTETWKEVPLD